jgi:fructokinase
VDLDQHSPTYGFITSTPKPGWAHTDLRGPLAGALQVPVEFETDVNAAAFGEHYWVTEQRSLDPLLYLTVGTGIGLGAVLGGTPLHGLLHPEAGHMLLPHDRSVDPFEGSCPFHGDCWEGLASGPAIAERGACPPESLQADHPGWELEVRYLALGVTNLLYCLSPKRVILGGGVMEQPALVGRIRAEVQRLVSGYLRSDRLGDGMDCLIARPALGRRSGALGALALAIACR